MEDAARIVTSEFKPGRCILGRLPCGGDLITTVSDFCRNRSIQTAVFSIIGSVRSATLGSYDQKQHVYVTFKQDEPLEILHCTGNVSLKNADLAVHAHGVFADINGQTLGGHIFSETAIYAGEIYLQELLGRPLARAYDEETGLFLWTD
jgi:predicted DNA-binding protein with PD1-like motif